MLIRCDKNRHSRNIFAMTTLTFACFAGCGEEPIISDEIVIRYLQKGKTEQVSISSEFVDSPAQLIKTQCGLGRCTHVMVRTSGGSIFVRPLAEEMTLREFIGEKEYLALPESGALELLFEARTFESSRHSLGSVQDGTVRPCPPCSPGRIYVR